MPPRKILYVIGSLNVGGAERHLTELLPRLDRQSWEPLVYCLMEKGELAAQLEAKQIPVYVSSAPPPLKGQSRLLRAWRILGATAALARFVLHERPEIVHFFLPAAYLLGAPAAVFARTSVRVMSRRSLNNYQRGHRLFSAAEPILHRFMHAILGNSRSVVRDLQSEGVPLRRLGLIYNGIDPSQFDRSATRQDVRQGLGIASDALVMIIVANLIRYKGHADLIEALALARAQLPDGWRLLVVGRDDGIGEELRRQVEACGLGGNIRFLGGRKDVPALLAASDIGILCSHEEGFPNAVLEGMASGLPMIVTDVGGNAEAVVNGSSGLVVPPKAPEQLAAAIAHLANEPQLRASFGRVAIQRISDVFTLDQCVRKYDELYHALVAGKEPGDVAGVRITNPI